MNPARVYPQDMSDLYEEAGIGMFYRGEYDFAVELFAAAYENAIEFNESLDDIVVKVNNLAVANYCLGNYEEAEKGYLHAMSDISEFLGLNHPHGTVVMSNYAVLLRRVGRHEEAEGMVACVEVLQNYPISMLGYLNSFMKDESFTRPVSAKEQANKTLQLHPVESDHVAAWMEEIVA